MFWKGDGGVGWGRRLTRGWKRGLYGRAGGLAWPRKEPLSCGDCSLAPVIPAYDMQCEQEYNCDADKTTDAGCVSSHRSMLC